MMRALISASPMPTMDSASSVCACPLRRASYAAKSASVTIAEMRNPQRGDLRDAHVARSMELRCPCR